MSKAEQFVIFIVLFIGAVSIAVLNDYLVRRSARKKIQPVDDRPAPDATPTPDASKTDWKMVVALVVFGPLLVYLSLFTTWFRHLLGGLHKGFVALVIGIIVLFVGLIALSLGRQYWRLRHLRRAVKLVREGNSARAIGML